MPKASNSRARRTPVAALSRRTGVVWGSLVASMTVVGGMLLVLQGDPTPRMDGLALASPVAAVGATPIETIFQTRRPVQSGAWEGIVIHHSGAPFGNAATIAAQHQARGLHGLGHHFLIGNGSGADDGELHVSYRWLDQAPGAHTGGPSEDYYNRRTIGICLVGDGDRKGFTPAQMRRLVQLVTALQIRLGIPADRVVLHSDVAPTTSPGRLFPLAEFRQSLVRQLPGE